MTEQLMTVTVDGVKNREARAWWFETRRGSNVSNAQRYAKLHGAAGMLHADDSFTLFYREGERVYRKTWKRVRAVLPAQAEQRG